MAISYDRVDAEYFAKRGLRRYARVWSLWALGVGAVISGNFFGWNFGLAAGGFGGLLLATVVMTVLYLGLCFSIAEMSPALPHTGGAYSFARSALGPFGGYVTGLAENMEYLLTPPVIVVGIGGYLGAIFGTPEAWAPLWWLGVYGVFVGLNVLGVEISFRFTVFITVFSLLILAIFYVAAVGRLDLERYAFDIVPEAGQSAFLPRGPLGILAALPFAMWFYLAIEQLPLAAEESHDPVKDLPRGLLGGFFTLALCAFSTLVLSAGSPPGAAHLGTSEEPLFWGFRALFGAGAGALFLPVLAVSGLLASFHSIVFAYGRQVYSLSRAGYFPRVLSLTHRTRKTPHVALLAGAVLGYGVALTIHLAGSEHPVGATLLNMAVFGAVVSYVLQLLSFIALRVRRPDLPRPYESPLGIPGALLSLLIALIALVTLVSLFVADPIYSRVVWAAAAWFGAGIAYFWLFARHRLVLAPEEVVAQGGAPPPA